MHESAMAAKIATIVEEEAAAQAGAGGSGKVSRVVVVAGRMHALVPESLQFHFDVIKKDSARLASAELIVQCKEIVVECGACQKTFELQDAIFICPDCSGQVKVLSGEELVVDSISMESGS